jgi:hypothetical protein
MSTFLKELLLCFMSEIFFYLCLITEKFVFFEE